MSGCCGQSHRRSDANPKPSAAYAALTATSCTGAAKRGSEPSCIAMYDHLRRRSSVTKTP